MYLLKTNGKAGILINNTFDLFNNINYVDFRKKLLQISDIKDITYINTNKKNLTQSLTYIHFIKKQEAKNKFATTNINFYHLSNNKKLLKVINIKNNFNYLYTSY